MKPKIAAQSGTFESSDVIFLTEPLPINSGRKIELNSTVMQQYGTGFRQIADDMLDQNDMSDIRLISKDKGALTKLSKGWMDEPTIPAPNKAYLPHKSKLCKSLEEAISRSNPHNGMTVSFHHHLLNGAIMLVQTLTILHNPVNYPCIPLSIYQNFIQRCQKPIHFRPF